ncbi:uncharacterized protein I206_107023 [Kwoniella pini CBS 10737]|uniref:5'-3' exoribonuclease n=1 Tax=Kwoniella pini CBS 10737 TaxID=1296096 RepID=A0A1B9HZG5_9TREE|nr:5'-3' exoribonuclease 2 [Kwoniella pini CBS 10737]OCF48654.1 5'-3' exoribonuclease 2 [Kwoniella pini CBS 10737]
MGVPALFRWLSKKYPKIVNKVVEEMPKKVMTEDGIVEIPVDISKDFEGAPYVDNLYLDMNGIVHPCTHPEGKPAPETEEEMMVEIFNYTERVVNMTRPRKVLMMAIDGVAPRAKMNQQRSRRFRAAQEAADKAEEKREAIKIFESMGHTVSEETQNQKHWDTNAITPGTPFMDLLSISLKYWVSHKLTTDPGWKNLKVILSDSSVPGEGEHKIMDWIRRQRSYSTWDANTSHVIYGLDADLIMLSLATHEPNFRVLREDVFAQGSKGPQPCKNCGQTGHLTSNCIGEKKAKDPNVVAEAKPVDPKPFIFLDVACLREYLAVELNLPGVPFKFDLELAIDDWIFMIFFVGNDFLPHLPSLEIREGAIDVLLKIWRAELPRMGGYLTNHGKVNLDRAQIILEGLAKSEDEIFQKRKEDEERQENNSKRRKIDDHRRQNEAKNRGNGQHTRFDESTKGTMQLNGTDYVAVTPSATARGGPLHPSLPTRPGFDLVPKDGTVKNKEDEVKKAMSNTASNSDIVKNRRAIRMANLSAAEALKAELLGENAESAEVDTVTIENTEDEEKEQLPVEEAKEILEQQGEDEGVDEEIIQPALKSDEDEGEAPIGEETMESDQIDSPERPNKRKRNGSAEDVEEAGEEDDEDSSSSSSTDDDTEAPPNPEADQPVPKKKLKVNPDGTVDGYEDDVKLWEPGYRERYYEKKFGVSLSDTEFIQNITKSYMEGLCWVLEYYYQGVPAWDWFYPYHYAPFAQDFKDIDKFNIEFNQGMPFTPYAQLLGVFPAASRIHLPEPLQQLMIDEDSPILDFYPSDFEIDMNGKKMAWQGVALLPFIDQDKLLAALQSRIPMLTDDERRRNTHGDSVMFVSNQQEYGLSQACAELYGLRAKKQGQEEKLVPLDPQQTEGTTGSILPDPKFIPGTTFETPIPGIDDCPDIENNESISVRYFFPRQAHPHRSVILSRFKPLPSRLTESDKDWVRRGGGGGHHHRHGGPRHSGGGGDNRTGGPGMARGGYHQTPQSSLPQNRTANGYPKPSPSDLARHGAGSGYGGSGGYNAPPPPRPVNAYGAPPSNYGYGGYGSAPPSAAGGYGGYGGYGGGTSNSNSYSAPQGGYAGYGNGSAYSAYNPPASTRPSPYSAPPPNPYGSPRPAYGAPPARGGYGGTGGSGSNRGGYNPYGGNNGSYQPRNNGGGGGGRRY